MATIQRQTRRMRSDCYFRWEKDIENIVQEQGNT